MEKKAKLIGLYLEIISSCNQQCVYCYNEEIIKKVFKLDLKVIQKVLLDAKSMGVDSITLSGGEPLLYDKVFELLDFCKEKKIHVDIITNATLITEYVAEKLAYYNPGIQFTLDSGISKIHNLSRGVGTYESQEKALKLLKSCGYRGSIAVRTNLWKQNYSKESLQSVFDFAEKHDIKNLDIALAHETKLFHDSLKSIEGLKLAEHEISELEQMYKKIKVNYQEKEVSIGCPFTGGENIVGFNVRISPEGDVYPCQMFDKKQFSFGNINILSIKEIMYGEKCKQFIDLMNLRKYFIPKCQNCGYQHLCNAGCPAKAIFSEGTIFAVDGTCRDRKNLLGNGLLTFTNSISN